MCIAKGSQKVFHSRIVISNRNRRNKIEYGIRNNEVTDFQWQKTNISKQMIKNDYKGAERIRQILHLK